MLTDCENRVFFSFSIAWPGSARTWKFCSVSGFRPSDGGKDFCASLFIDREREGEFRERFLPF
jgi:hypothetical protein